MVLNKAYENVENGEKLIGLSYLCRTKMILVTLIKDGKYLFSFFNITLEC